MIPKKYSLIYVAVFLFPILIATVQHGGGILYALIFLFGALFGWAAWWSLEPWEKRVLIGFLIFFVLVSLSLMNTQDYVRGMKKVERYIHFPLFIPMYLLLKRCQIEAGKTFLYGFLISSIVLFGQSLYQIITMSSNRASGAYSPLFLGDISILLVMIVVCALFTLAQNYKHYLLGGLAVVLSLSVGMMSGSRGALLMLPIAVVWFVWVKHKNIHMKDALYFSFASCLIIGIFSASDLITKRTSFSVDIQMLYQEPLAKTSVSTRLNLWRDAVTIWKEHPLIGTGIGDYSSHKALLFKEGRSNMSTNYGHAHSIYFDLLATTGLAGLTSMIVFVLVMPFMMFYSHWRDEVNPWLQFYALAGMTTIISFAVFGLTEGWLARNPFVRTYLMCILVFMSSIAVVKSRKSKVVVSEEAP